MRIWRRVVALILVSVVAAAALVPPVAALDEMRLPILDVITKLSNAWGGFDPESIYCYNCGGEVTLKQLEEYDGGLAGAICPYCSKSLMFDSGTFPIGGFKGFGEGQSRGAGAGIFEGLSDDEVERIKQQYSQSFVRPSGVFYPVDSIDVDDNLPYGRPSTVGNTLSYTGAYYLYLFGYHHNLGSNYYYTYNFTPPFDGDYKFYFSYHIAGTKFIDKSPSSPSFGEVTGSLSGSFYSNSYSLDSGSVFPFKFVVPNSGDLSKIPYFFGYASDNSGKAYTFSAFLEVWAVLQSDSYQPTDNEIVDTELKTIIVNGDTITYNNIYEYGDTYIVYQNSGDDSPAIVYVKDPQTGEVIGMSWYDPSGNCYYYTDFTVPDPTPTPAPTSVPGPTPTPDPGGDGGDGGDDGSGGGIWDTIAQGIADFIGVLGKLLGGILSGFVNLLTELVGSLTAVVPLIENISGVLSGLYSFLPEPWQLLLNSAFTFLLVFAVVKLVLGFGK